MDTKLKLRQMRKEHIIRAALRVIVKEGYHNLNMEKIAKESGMSKGGIVYYFRSKKELFKSVFIYFFDTIFSRSKKIIENIQDPIEKLISFVWIYNWDDADIYSGYSILFDFMSLAHRDEEYGKIFHSWIESWIELLKGILLEAQERGILSTDIDIDGTARAISAIYQGIGERWYLDKNYHKTEWAVSYLKRGILGLIRSHLKN